MFVYKIPVEAVTKHQLGVGITSEIREGVTCNGFEIRREGDLHLFVKESEKELSDILEEVDIILALLSFHNPNAENFKIVESGISVIPKTIPEEPKVSQEDGTTTIELKETVHISEHLDIGLTRINLNDIEEALPRLNETANRALRWFYIGNLQPKQTDTFLAHYIAFEILMESISDPTRKIMDILDEKRRGELKEKLTSLMQEYLTENDMKRMVSYLSNANAQSENDRYAKALLQELGIAADATVVKGLRDLRGAIVHNGERPEDVKAKLDVLDSWVKHIMMKKYSLMQ